MTLFLNKLEFICLQTVKWFHILLFIVCILLNDRKCYNLTLVVHFEMLVRFFMVCDVICKIGIPNLVNLS